MDTWPNPSTYYRLAVRAVCLILAVVLITGTTQTVCAAHILTTSHLTGAVLGFDSTTGLLDSTVVPHGSMGGPIGMVISPHDGSLLIGSELDDVIYRTDQILGGGTLSVFVSGGGLSRPERLAYGPDGHLYVSNRNGDEVLKFDGVTGSSLGGFSSGGGLLRPTGLAFSPHTNNLLVASSSTDQILEYEASTGLFLGVFASGGLLDDPHGIRFGPDGDLYVAANDSDAVIRYDGHTGLLVANVITGASISLPQAVAFLDSNTMLVASEGNKNIVTIDLVTQTVIDQAAAGGGLDYPVDILVIPEPSTLVLLAAGGLGLMRRRAV